MESIIASIVSTPESNNIFGLTSKNLGVADKENNEFMKIFEEVLEKVKSTEEQSNAASESLLNNTIDDLHTVMIEMAKAELTLGLALQVRNKVIESYNEIMRMQI